MAKKRQRSGQVSSPRMEPTVGLLLAAGFGRAIGRSPWPLVTLILGWQLIEVAGDLASKAGWAMFVNAAIGALVGAGGNTALAWLVALSAVALAAWRGRLYRQQVRGSDERIRALEDHVDPERSSSGLTIDGTTHPEDED